MPRARASATIRDVADAAGVSVSTVSRVLNNKDDVAPETQQKIRDVIDRLGYASSLAARSLRSHKTGVLGLVIYDLAEAFGIQVLRGVDQAIKKLDYDLIIYTGGDFRQDAYGDRERRFIYQLDSNLTDGILIVVPTATTFSTVSPIVVIDPNMLNSDYPAVIATNHAGALEMMKYLTSLGHRRIGHIIGRQELISSEQRLQGYKDGLCQAGIPFDPQLVEVGDYSRLVSAACARRLLELPDPPTAIFASNDQSALGVYDAAQAAGLRIPEDLSVAGFDNIPESALVTPALTTTDQFIVDMGVIATEMLVKLISGEVLQNQIYEIPTRLVIRDSCRALTTQAERET
jgi:LacI family transcriptional regulator